ncbi:hypothetical protein [Streptomyces vietnamensis]|uniref:hypothetical protein n=1 Tax=Streptomyces vietnamensis TaxID=362257 RepID=UPI0006960BA1|nr:hypothetical protein [Streptomyces vietnamensis]
MRTALRTALATALVAGVVATPVLAAGSAFAAGTTPAPTATATATAAAAEVGVGAGASEGTLVRTVQLAGGLSAKVYAKGDQHPYYTATVLKGGTVLGELKAGAGYPPKETKVFGGYAVTLDSEGNVTAAAVQHTGGTLVRTQTLIGGTIAKIYKVKEQNYRAELFRDGHPVGVLEAITRSVAGQDNGEFFVLNPDGTTYNWVGNIAPGTPGIYRLVDGTVVELGKKDGAFGLQKIDPATDKGSGYIYVHGARKVYFFGKAVVVLEQDGQFSAYVPGSAKQAAPKPYGMGGGGQPTSGPTAGPVVTLGKCTVRQDIPSVFALLTVTLTNDLEKGPKAVLKDEAGKPIVTLDRAHSADRGQGLTIKGANTTTPQLGQRTQGGDTPYRWTAFPKLPKGCEKGAAVAASASAGNTGITTNTGQTSVIPRGGVAAGAEFAAEGDSTALIASGVGAASLAAAGLGFVVLRRRAAAARA